MVLADSGEDSIVFCTSCDYAANVEKAEIHQGTAGAGDSGKAEEQEALQLVETKDKRTVEEVTRFLDVDPSQLVKSLVYRTEKGDFAVLVRGDREANEHKIKKVLDVETAAMASPEEVEQILGVPAGYVGPVNMPLPILADHPIRILKDVVVGANVPDHHYLHFDPARDLRSAQFADLRVAQAGDLCPRCGKLMEERRGIEVGHVFMLGTKYSKSLRATFLDPEGKERPIWMGCYGIGVGRTLAAAIEQNHDRDGICFPFPIAPFSVILTALNPKDAKIQTVSEGLYATLQQKGVEVLLDDRDERPGKKFKDADLIGIPLRVTVGPRHLQEGNIEIKLRREADPVTVPVEGAVDHIFGLLQDHGQTNEASS
jgi:prolyl-tRNA synthetase